MKILVLNAGSSSLKYQLLDTASQSIMAKGVVEKIGLNDTFLGFTNGSHPKVEKNIHAANHDEALKEVFASLVEGPTAVIKDLNEIHAIGHRVVHGGEVYSQPTLVTEAVLTELDKLSDIAPLHNPPNIMGIRACQKIVPQTPQVAVFDTAFHQTMEPVAYMYGLPYEYYEKYGIRRYGFHGTSYAYVTQEAAKFLNKSQDQVNLIVCHIGNGASMAAIKNGKSIDTSMGFTPLEGLMMGTRSGSLDPAAVLYIMEKEKLTPAQASDLLNKQSGLKGVSGVSSDMRDVEAAADQGNKQAKLAKDMMAHYIRRMLGAYLVELDAQVDAIVFTAGMGEFDVQLRAQVTAGLSSLGIEIDQAVNKESKSKLRDISTPSAKIRTLVVPTNEELMIALETQEVVK
ncbi:acetate kinase [Brevinema andersonii]|uniref:Acetate kinase n=1 Tax=Brevinema andersonii TaxID=34097 RepID=A0A1I1E0H9_BREAD|nr:acetate kinase [Brevinema andersonii]SFB80162.1 acetate kinase [Brevinema andersonii]